MNRYTIVLGTLTAAAMSLITSTVSAGELAAPEGIVILTFSGEIENTNVGDTAQFDRAMLEAMEPVEFSTTTIWTEGEQTFTGVSLKTVLEAVGNEGTEIKATAFNDYGVTIPLSDAVEGGAVIAYTNNGKEMSRRDKGPLWIVYPYDSNINYRTETTYSRSIWQLDRLNAE